MIETRRIFGKERISKCRCSALKYTGAASRLPAALGIMCAVLLALTAVIASAQERTPMRTATKAPVLRQLRRAETIYRMDTQIRLEETTIKVELGSLEALNGWWQFLFQMQGESPEGATVPKALEALKELGETAVLHSGVCLLSDTEQASIYSTKRIPAQTTRTGSGGTTLASVQYRDLGTKLSAHLEGMDVQRRICFSYNVDLNYMVGESDEANPAYASFNTEGRARVRNGETLVIPNFDGSTGLLIFLTPRAVK